jgi:hypothetical protein
MITPSRVAPMRIDRLGQEMGPNWAGWPCKRRGTLGSREDIGIRIPLYFSSDESQIQVKLNQFHERTT